MFEWYGQRKAIHFRRSGLNTRKGAKVWKEINLSSTRPKKGTEHSCIQPAQAHD